MACFPRFNAFPHRSVPSSVLRETNIAILASIIMTNKTATIIENIVLFDVSAYA